MRTPVALIIFNRPETTARVFAEIARARPPKLLVIADGPRRERPGEAEKCLAARRATERVDWDCEVLTNYSDENMGCQLRPATGLDWVFEMVEEAIILEDDCLPDQSFFPFCEELLERYRTDERVMMVSGTNLLREWKSDVQSYQFTKWGANWGWATWRRAWRFFDRELKLWPQVRESRLLRHLLPDPNFAAYWESIFEAVYRGEIVSAWDFQWLLACWMQNGLSIFPEVNLVSNIGFGMDATHTTIENSAANVPTQELAFPLRHPPFVIRCVEADKLLEEKYYSPGASPSLVSRLKARVARTLKLV